LVVLVELRPVQSHDDIHPGCDHKGNPLLKPLPHGDAAVAQKPVDLLDRMLRVEPHRVGEAAADRVHSERCGMENADNASGERLDACRVNVVAKQLVHELVDALRRNARRCGSPSGCLDRAFFNSGGKRHAQQNAWQTEKFLTIMEI
jgi:hypothetical protein